MTPTGDTDLTLRPLTSYETKVFAFMDAGEYTRGHGDTLRAIEASYDETHAEAGPNGKYDDSVTAALARIAARREEVIQRAVERYEDWASD